MLMLGHRTSHLTNTRTRADIRPYEYATTVCTIGEPNNKFHVEYIRPYEYATTVCTIGEPNNKFHVEFLFDSAEAPTKL